MGLSPKKGMALRLCQRECNKALIDKRTSERYTHLDSLAKVVAATLLLDDLEKIRTCVSDFRPGRITHVLVDLAGGDVVVTSQGES